MFCHSLSTMSKLMTKMKLKHVSRDKNDKIYIFKKHESIAACKFCISEAPWEPVSQAARLLHPPRATHSSLTDSLSPLWDLAIAGPGLQQIFA